MSPYRRDSNKRLHLMSNNFYLMKCAFLDYLLCSSKWKSLALRANPKKHLRGAPRALIRLPLPLLLIAFDCLFHLSTLWTFLREFQFMQLASKQSIAFYFFQGFSRNYNVSAMKIDSHCVTQICIECPFCHQIKPLKYWVASGEPRVLKWTRKVESRGKFSHPWLQSFLFLSHSSELFSSSSPVKQRKRNEENDLLNNVYFLSFFSPCCGV